MEGLVMDQATKSAALMRLAAGVSHDLNNIFMVIGGNLSMLKELWPVPNEANDVLVETLLSVKQGIDLAKRLQSYAGRQNLHAQDLNLGGLIRDGIDLFQVTSSRDWRVALFLPDTVCLAHVDREMMLYTITELATNACCAMASILEITLSRCSELDMQGFSFAKAGQGYLCVSFADSGAGMSPEVLANAEDPLFTTKLSATSKLGWGLSTIQGFVRQSGGQLVLGRSDLGGARVDIYLPLVE
jgi:signal transduction histidine kinase